MPAGENAARENPYGRRPASSAGMGAPKTATMTSLPSVTLLRVDFAPVALPPLSGILDDLVPDGARARLAAGTDPAQLFEAEPGALRPDDGLEGTLTVLASGSDRAAFDVRLLEVAEGGVARFGFAAPLALEAQPAWLRNALDQRARPRVVLPREDELRACLLLPNSTTPAFGRVLDASAMGLGLCLEQPLGALECGTRLRVSLFFGPDAPPSPCYATVAHTHVRNDQQLVGLQLQFRHRDNLPTYHALRAFLQERLD